MVLSIEVYAAVMAELVGADALRREVLARRGLDERSWSAADDHGQERLSEAMAVDGDEIPAVLGAYAAAYAAAQEALGPPITIEQLATVTRLLQAGGDLRAALARVGVTLAEYVRGSEHWSGRLATDPDLLRVFEAALRAG